MYTFHLWHVPAALLAACAIHLLCIMRQNAKRDTEARKAWRQSVVDEEKTI